MDIGFLEAKLTESIQLCSINKANAVLYSESCWNLELDGSFEVIYFSSLPSPTSDQKYEPLLLYSRIQMLEML